MIIKNPHPKTPLPEASSAFRSIDILYCRATPWHKMLWSHDAKWCIVNRDDIFDNPCKEKPPLLASVLSHSSAHIHQPQIDESTLIAMQHHMARHVTTYYYVGFCYSPARHDLDVASVFTFDLDFGLVGLWLRLRVSQSLDVDFASASRWT